MKCSENTIWIENILFLFCSDKLIPMNGMSVANQMNSITRLVILITIVLYLFNYKNTLMFFMLSILFIIILYYNQMSNDKERFKMNTCTGDVCGRYSLDHTTNPGWVSENKKLMGGANPKTFIQPTVVNHSHNLDYWKANENVIHSAINDDTHCDDYVSGYVSTPSCPRVQQTSNTCHQMTNDPYLQLPFRIGGPEPTAPRHHMVQSVRYNPENIYNNIPVNIQYANQVEPNQFIQTIQPGIYTKNQIIEPIHSNIGISHTQPFQHVNRYTDPNGSVSFTETDPYMNQYKTHIQLPSRPEHAISQAHIYDPRFTGYGTSYRSYIEPVTGQPRHYYDDVDSIRMPNYITRNNIDTQPYAETYGPVTYKQGIPNNENVRALANQSFLDATIQQRTELSERLMRKGNARAWQNRLAPKYT